MNRSPLRPMSDRRRAELAEVGVLFPSSTFAPKRLQTSGRLPLPTHRPASTGPDWSTVQAVLERDSWSCVVCGGGIWGERGTDWSIGHRRPRRSGGDPRPETNATANLITLHGTGTTGCHGVIESLRDQAKAKGWLLKAQMIPAREPMQHATHGWVLLNDQGGWKPAATEAA